MIEMERKTKISVISTVLILAVLSGIALMAYANGVTNDTSTAANVACGSSDQFYAGARPFFGRQAFGWGRGEFINVSEEFKDGVINIAKSDQDVQKLLADGYNITGVRPIITSTVEANGNVAIKATSAIVMLHKDTTGSAFVWVDVGAGKVTRIEISTRTLIEKP
jgi:Tfp pilus assembly protein PilE